MPTRKKRVSKDAVGALAIIGLSNVEIGHLLGVHEKTIRRKFSKLLVQKRAEMRKNLRAAQIQNALEGNVAMQTHVKPSLSGFNGAAVCI